MKKLAILLSSFVFYSTFFAQTFDVFYDDFGDPFGIKIYDSIGVHKIQIDKAPENGVIDFEHNGVHHFLNFQEDLQPNLNINNRDDVDNYEPGILPEGDLVIDLEYSKDGSILASVNQHNNVIWFYDSETYEVLATVEVGRSPVDIEFDGSSAYVCCNASKEVYKISLMDFSIVDIFPFNRENARNIEFNYDETIYYVSFHNPNTYLGGYVEAYNMQTGENIFATEQTKIFRSHREGIHGRFVSFYDKIVLSPSENLFICAKALINEPIICNGLTGEVIKHYEGEAFKEAIFSVTGDTIFLITVEKGNADWVILRRIERSGLIVIDSILTHSVWNSINGIAANADGTKVLSADRWNKVYLFFDFVADTCYHIEEDNSIKSPIILSTSNRNNAFTKVYEWYRIFDFESGEFVASTHYDDKLSNIIAINPADEKFAVTRWLGYGYYDQFYTFDFSDLDNIFIDTLIVAGELPEADVVSSAVLSNNGSKLYSANSYSSNLSIIDYQTGVLDTLIYIAGIQKIKTIPNSDLIFLFGRAANSFYLYDPLKYQVIKKFNIIRINSVFYSEDGQYAYAYYDLGIHATLYKILLDGESSEVIDDLYFRTKSCEIAYSSSGLDDRYSTVGITPDTRYLLASHENSEEDYAILVIDTELMDTVAVLPAPGGWGCLMACAFTPDSKRAYVSRLNTTDLIVYLDGEDSYIEHSIDNAINSYSAIYNPGDGYFYVLNVEDWYLKVDPVSGEIVEWVSTDDHDSWQIGLDQNHEPVIRQTFSLLYEGEYYDLLGSSKDFSYHADNNLFVIPIPGPDAVSVFNPLTVSIDNYPKKQIEDRIHISPNPANDKVIVSSERTFHKVEIVDLQGKLVYEGIFNNKKTTISLTRLKQGIYIVKVYSNNKTDSQKLVVSR